MRGFKRLPYIGDGEHYNRFKVHGNYFTLGQKYKTLLYAFKNVTGCNYSVTILLLKKLIYI